MSNQIVLIWLNYVLYFVAVAKFLEHGLDVIVPVVERNIISNATNQMVTMLSVHRKFYGNPLSNTEMNIGSCYLINDLVQQHHAAY